MPGHDSKPMTTMPRKFLITAIAAIGATTPAAWTLVLPHSPQENPIVASIDAGSGVFVAGKPAIVKISFTNRSKTRAKLDGAYVTGLGVYLSVPGQGTKPAIDESALGKEAPYEIPPGGTLTCSVDIAPQVTLFAGKLDTASLGFDLKGVTAEPVSVELIEDLTKTVVVFKTTKGTMKFRVDEAAAPLNSRNFVRHAKMGTFTGTSFHRVLRGFVAQGGDPNSKDTNPDNDGSGGSPYNNKPLPAEIGEKKHVRGTLSMARNGDPAAQINMNPQFKELLRQVYSKLNPDPNFVTAKLNTLEKEGFFKDRKPFLDSAGSQFFICFGPTAALDGGYTAFGDMIEGDDVLKKIEAVAAMSDQDNRGRPKEEIKIVEATVETVQ
jgi:peptidyl-prolyl cis-trans isomerase B (cyclophilin B)